MAQHDMIIDNAPGLGVRQDMNAAVQALVSTNSGPVEPTVKYPGMLWLDTSVTPNGIVRQRNLANDAWVGFLSSETTPGEEIHAAPAKTVPADADEIPLSNSASTPDAWQQAKISFTNLKAAIIGALGLNIHGAPVKAALVDADELGVADSVSTPTAWALKRHPWGTLKEAARAYAIAAANLFTARQHFKANVTANNGMAVATPSLGEIEVQSSGTGAAMMAFLRSGLYAAYFGLDTDNAWKVGGWSMGASAYRVLHEGLPLASLEPQSFVRQRAYPQEATVASYTPAVDGVANIRYWAPPAGAYTINAPGASPQCFTMVVAVSHSAASTGTLAGFTKVTGDPMPTAVGGTVMLYITRVGGYCTCFIETVV